jgi:hypothetical protein
MKKTKNLSKKTIDLLKKFQEYILEEPRRFNLSLWGEIANPKEFEQIAEDRGPTDVTDQRPPCGTVGCVAGSICVLTGVIKPKTVLKGLSSLEVYSFPNHTPEMAAKALGLPLSLAEKLFYLKSWRVVFNKEEEVYPGWPEKFEEELEKHKPGSQGYAKVTVARIQHFIDTDGAE